MSDYDKELLHITDYSIRLATDNLFNAIRGKDLSEAKIALFQGADPNHIICGSTPLDYIMDVWNENSYDLFMLLLQSGMKIIVTGHAYARPIEFYRERLEVWVPLSRDELGKELFRKEFFKQNGFEL